MSRPSRHPNVRQLFLALSSAVLLVLSFPSFNQWWCAWVALVPWLLLLRQASARAAFWWSYLIGAIFFLASIWWLTYVTGAGWILLCAVLALYFGLFGWLARRMLIRDAAFTACLTLPALWVMLEYLRSHLLSGFGWNLLAYSQAPWLEAIQIADLTGAWGVSFLIVLVNAGAAVFLMRKTRRTALGLTATLGILAMALAYGVVHLPERRTSGPVRVAVVQGNIPQEKKWDDAYQQTILERYAALTAEAAKTMPDLIIWPETSVPGYFGAEEPVTQPVFELADAIAIPLLVGAPMFRVTPEGMLLTNSAALVAAGQGLIARYDKLHLVPFGEFIPFERQLPWLRQALPPIGDFIPGSDPTVFRLPDRSALSVLVCFEDLFPELARGFVRRGAKMLAVITNDAWFGPTAAAYQHAQASTLRAVELRVPIVRAANTGWSGCIDSTGRWVASVHDAQGTELFVPGTQSCELWLGDAQPTRLYLRWGDWFVWVCLAVLAIFFIRQLLPRQSVASN